MKEAQKARLEELQKEHGRITHTLLKDGTLLVFRAPTLKEWDRYQEQKARRNGPAFRELAQTVCVEPDLETIKKAFAKYPASNTPIGNSLRELAGGDTEFIVEDDGTAHGELPDGTRLAFRTPTLDEWEEFQESLNAKLKDVAYREIAQIARIEPDEEGLKKAFAKYPASNIPIINVLSELAGGEIELTVKKG